VLRILGFSAGARTRTIGEAQPYLSQSILQQQALTATNRILSDYGFTLFTAIVGGVWMLAKPLVREGETRQLAFVVGGLALVGLLFLIPAIPAGIGAAFGVASALVSLAVAAALLAGAVLLADHDAERLFVVVWAAFITAAAFTQVRFNYYLAIPVVVMNAFLLGELLRYFDLTSLPSKLEDIEGYQVMAVLAVVLLITAPVLVVPLNVRSTGNPQFDRSQNVLQAANQNPIGGVTQWQGSLAWMRNETPVEGTMGGANNEMEYYGTYQRTDDFAYEPGTYGVMSWWDYGHWITVLGERIPNANPFQQGARTAANYLLAPSEQAANDVLASQSEEGENTRYVMVDWQMATPGSKFGAPTVFYNEANVSQSDFYETVYSSDLKQSFRYRHQRYYESQMIRLYEYHGSAVEPAPVVLDWEDTQAQTQSGDAVSIKTVPRGNESVVKTFDNVSAAREFVERDGSSQVGGLGAFPEERVPALEHYRLVRVSNASALDAPGYQREYANIVRQTNVPYRSLTQTQHSWVKTFEKVPGATVEGSGAPPNATVRATVRMRVPTDGSTFVYTQQATADENGEFTMTLPYATTGYDEYGPENGYTNVSVRAEGPYTLQTAPQINQSGYVVRTSANLTVSEGLVNGARDGPETVTLERSSQQLQTGNATVGGNESASAVRPIGVESVSG
jgi:dolichyl-diphosphooligosaccharide--protein glycosyltransferase